MIGQSFTTCLVEKTIAALVGTSIGRWLLLKMLKRSSHWERCLNSCRYC
ncbi:hypothetical protein Gohar_013887 [Gossypium harknessii]|uniref:Uncharacterized protein n=1 Tax=Gossypium harknessii TaxID=34285 RepID=A0A7J9H1I4_9ROSI|nr:hypothetical protein [Gossypium harknessii]